MMSVYKNDSRNIKIHEKVNTVYLYFKTFKDKDQSPAQFNTVETHSNSLKKKDLNMQERQTRRYIKER